MRDLTEEIKSIPKCCCDVSVFGFEDVECNFSIVYCRCGGLISAVPVGDVETFDITEHEFSCENFKACKPSWIGDDLQIEIIDSDFTHHDALLNKDDAIAIAKALGVTGEDLLWKNTFARI